MIAHSLDGAPLGGFVFTPTTAGSSLPFLIYLHGAGERGSNPEHLFRHAIPRLIREGREYPAILLVPQCPAPFTWQNLVSALRETMDTVAKAYAILPDRISLTGSSMGGFGAWEMALTYPNIFSAVAPVAGGGSSWRCPNLRSTPIYAYHGAADTVVPPIYSSLMVEATRNSGGNAELTLFDGLGHNDGIDYAYRSTDLIPRLLRARRTDFEKIPEFLEEMF